MKKNVNIHVHCLIPPLEGPPIEHHVPHAGQWGGWPEETREDTQRPPAACRSLGYIRPPGRPWARASWASSWCAGSPPAARTAGSSARRRARPPRRRRAATGWDQGPLPRPIPGSTSPTSLTRTLGPGQELALPEEGGHTEGFGFTCTQIRHFGHSSEEFRIFERSPCGRDCRSKCRGRWCPPPPARSPVATSNPTTGKGAWAAEAPGMGTGESARAARTGDTASSGSGASRPPCRRYSGRRDHNSGPQREKPNCDYYQGIKKEMMQISYS